MPPLSADVIRAEQHGEIGQLIASNVGIILERWCMRAAEEQPQARRVHHDVLMDHFTEFLQTLGQSLMAAEPENSVTHRRPAAKHGAQRWDAGWSLPEVIRDYQILRRVLLEFLEESLERALRHREVLAIGLALDESITFSVVVYIKGRDEHMARMEKQRIEELQRVKGQLQAQTEGLLQADRQKNEFLAVLAHELRNPLAPVRDAVHILRLKNLPDPELHWAAELIERQTHQLGRMIDDLSDISRITHGKIKLEKAHVSIASCVQRAVEEVHRLVEARKHRLTVNLAREAIWLEADPQRVTQILVNLLINAAKYTNEGGEIHLSAERQGDDAVLRVRDNGMGIPPELLQRIFEPFVQEHQAENRIQGGLGIGLALVRKLVDLHCGRVHASSGGRGAGSEFIVHLPALNAPQASETPAPLLSETIPARRILVVDDNRDAATSLGILLKLMGHEVQTAHDGPSAIETISAKPLDIVLLDIGMPHMNGLEVARQIRQNPRLEKVVLVALTGYGQDQDRKRSLNAGFDVHLVKPVELSHLYAALRHPKIAADGAEPPALPS